MEENQQLRVRSCRFQSDVVRDVQMFLSHRPAGQLTEVMSVTTYDACTVFSEQLSTSPRLFLFLFV